VILSEERLLNFYNFELYYIYLCHKVWLKKTLCLHPSSKPLLKPLLTQPIASPLRMQSCETRDPCGQMESFHTSWVD